MLVLTPLNCACGLRYYMAVDGVVGIDEKSAVEMVCKKGRRGNS